MMVALGIVTMLLAVALVVCVVALVAARSERSAHDIAAADIVALGAAASEPSAVQVTSHLVTALDALPLGVVVASTSGGVVYENLAARTLLRATDSLSLVNRAVREMVEDAVSGSAVEREIDLFGPPKATYLLRGMPLVGDPSGGVVVVEDITERRRTDEVRRDFVSNISHELKTPVGAVALLAETLRDETDLDTVGRFAGRISVEVARLARTIDDLLELSRIEFGDDLVIEEVNVASVIEEAAGRFAGAAEARGLAIHTVVDRDVALRGDRRQIISALSNLIDNAVKYSPDGATIAVGGEVVGEDGDAVVISVADQGVGIPTRDLGRVFERFYRVDRARSRDTGGTGLGLAIVRHIAQNHGGEVSLTSREGHGSTFTLRLPVSVVSLDATVDVAAESERSAALVPGGSEERR